MKAMGQRPRCGSIRGPGGQRGVALAIALIFLVVITLVGLVAMRSSVVEIKLARNNQFEIEATQKAQAVVDAVLEDKANFSSTLKVGEISCYDSGANAPTACEQSGRRALLNANGELFQTGVYAEVQRLAPARVPVPVPSLTSMDKFTAAAFSVRGQFNRAQEGLGAADIEVGVIKILPRYSRIR